MRPCGANGDIANKIGTLGVSILAKYYNIPFYVAPTPTIDLKTPTGKEIPIEERDASEVINRFGQYSARKKVKYIIQHLMLLHMKM